MAEWQPMSTAPDDEPILAAVHVMNNRTGKTHWERHIIWKDDEGHLDQDAHQGWEWGDYSYWQPLPPPPVDTKP